MMTAEHHSLLQLRMDLREQWKYYSSEKRSALTSQIDGAKHRPRMPLGMDMRE